MSTCSRCQLCQLLLHNRLDFFTWRVAGQGLLCWSLDHLDELGRLPRSDMLLLLKIICFPGSSKQLFLLHIVCQQQWFGMAHARLWADQSSSISETSSSRVHFFSMFGYLYQILFTFFQSAFQTQYLNAVKMHLKTDL